MMTDGSLLHKTQRYFFEEAVMQEQNQTYCLRGVVVRLFLRDRVDCAASKSLSSTICRQGAEGGVVKFGAPYTQAC